MLVSFIQRKQNWQNIHVYIEKEIYFKKLAYVFMEDTKSKIFRVGW